MVNDLDSIDDLELMPLGGGYMVRRERLLIWCDVSVC